MRRSRPKPRPRLKQKRRPGRRPPPRAFPDSLVHVLAAVILSAGESSRMGSPKALLPLGGTTFLGRLLEIIHESKRTTERGKEISCTRVVLGAHTKEITQKIPLDPSAIVVNPQWQQG